MKPNVRLQTNVLCIRQGDERLSHNEIVSRLGYFELMEYRRIHPILWGSTPDYRWTDRQKWELEGPRGRSNGGLGSLWRRRPDLNPVPSIKSRNPFEHPTTDPTSEGEPKPPPEPILPLGPAPTLPVEIVSEQDEVITAGINEDLLVVAPPGTGKTHTLVERISHLVAQRHVENPREQILVLSFTRSAVAELKKRLIAKVRAGGPDDLLYVQIRTFDSLATNFLRQDLDSGAIVNGYAERIGQFNELFAAEKLPQTKEALSGVRFLLVDEVQDLNGHRARMVLAIAREVARNNGCSMFLGDPAQAIYDYEEDDSDNALTSVDFLRQLYQGTYCGRPPVQRQYSEYRRFETEAMLDFVRKARTAMGSDGLSPDGSHLDELLGTLGDRIPLANVPTAIDLSVTTAILTRNNLEAYWIWDWLRERGVVADLWRGARGSYWPGWIGRLFLGFQGESISMEMAQKRWEKHVAPYVDIDFQQAIRFLQSQGIMESGADHIPLAAIANFVLNSAPVLADGGPRTRIVISTIHRSKGLEFDDVLLLAPSRMNSDEDARVVYVAATRAKRSLRVLKRDEKVIRNGGKRDRGINTSGFHVFSYPEAPQIGLLVDGHDVIDPDSILALDEPLSAQKRLWEECAGRPRTMDVSGVSAAVSGCEFGGLSRRIVEDIRTLRRVRGAPESALGGLRIVDLATVSFPSFGSHAQEELGTACMAIVPVVTGVTSI